MRRWIILTAAMVGAVAIAADKKHAAQAPTEDGITVYFSPKGRATEAIVA